MSEPRFRARDPRCSRFSSSLKTGSSSEQVATDKELKSSPASPSPPLPAKRARLSSDKMPEKEYDPESPMSDIILSSSPALLHSPAKQTSPVQRSYVPSSFLVCAVCGNTPSSIPLYGCELSHIVCSSCRSVGGSLLSCPRCGSQDISHHLTIAEELLEAEQKKNCLVFCHYKVEGCTTVTRRQVMSQHKEQCLFRPVKCPKAMFSLSCSHIGPFCTIQQHGRDKHNLHQGVTVLELGVISSKMFDKGPDATCCDDLNNAKFQVTKIAS